MDLASLRRLCMLRMISQRWSSDASFQSSISLRLLQHPIQKFVLGFILHIDIQGDTTSFICITYHSKLRLDFWYFKVESTIGRLLMSPESSISLFVLPQP